MPKNSSKIYFYAEEGGTPTPYMGAHWRHLANTIFTIFSAFQVSYKNALYKSTVIITEPSVCGGDAVLWQITLPTCLKNFIPEPPPSVAHPNFYCNALSIIKLEMCGRQGPAVARQAQCTHPGEDTPLQRSNLRVCCCHDVICNHGVPFRPHRGGVMSAQRVFCPW